MFEVEYKGANGLIIATKAATVVVDPKLSLVGLADLKVDNVVEVATEERFLVEGDGARLIIDGPGEYEVGDFSIRGIGATRHIDAPESQQLATIYRIEISDIRIGLLGNIAPKLNDEQLEALGVLDILILPVGGGGYTLDATSASTLVHQIDPKVVIPIHYADTAVKYEVPQDTLEAFVKELGSPTEKVTKYKIKGTSSLPQALSIIEIGRS